MLLLDPEFLIDEREYKNYFRGVAKKIEVKNMKIQ